MINLLSRIVKEILNDYLLEKMALEPLWCSVIGSGRSGESISSVWILLCIQRLASRAVICAPCTSRFEQYSSMLATIIEFSFPVTPSFFPLAFFFPPNKGSLYKGVLFLHIAWRSFHSHLLEMILHSIYLLIIPFMRCINTSHLLWWVFRFFFNLLLFWTMPYRFYSICGFCPYVDIP